MIDYTTYITAASITINIVLGWAWYRRRELIILIKQVRDAARDSQVTEDEFLVILDDLDTVIDKK